MNGYDVCRTMKQDAALRAIPVIFISALSEPFDKLQAFAAGGVDYVTKPFHLDEVPGADRDAPHAAEDAGAPRGAEPRARRRERASPRARGRAPDPRVRHRARSQEPARGHPRERRVPPPRRDAGRAAGDCRRRPLRSRRRPPRSPSTSSTWRAWPRRACPGAPPSLLRDLLGRASATAHLVTRLTGHELSVEADDQRARSSSTRDSRDTRDREPRSTTPSSTPPRHDGAARGSWPHEGGASPCAWRMGTRPAAGASRAGLRAGASG